jgi:deoxycytidylate deaminase
MLTLADPFPRVGYFRLAYTESLKSTYKIKVGAVLAGTRPITVGYNKLKTHPKFANPDKNLHPSIHAEIACLIQLRARLKGDTIYVYREKEKKPALSRPCPACMDALRKHGVKHIFYSVEKYPYYCYERI